jgi:ketosteroid isomerase-like protein
VVLPNEDLLTVGTYIDLKNTPVLIGENIQWLNLPQWQQHQLVFNQIHQQWEKDWESLDVEDYLAHYSARFYSGKQNYVSWAEHKRRVAQYKTFVDVELSNLSLLLHPNEDVMVATYLQSYNSDNFSSQSWKRQYWNREADGQWRIVFEGEIAAPVTEQLARN